MCRVFGCWLVDWLTVSVGEEAGVTKVTSKCRETKITTAELPQQQVTPPCKWRVILRCKWHRIWNIIWTMMTFYYSWSWISNCVIAVTYQSLRTWRGRYLLTCICRLIVTHIFSPQSYSGIGIHVVSWSPCGVRVWGVLVSVWSVLASVWSVSASVLSVLASVWSVMVSVSSVWTSAYLFVSL
jgi:hypothetical protein